MPAVTRTEAFAGRNGLMVVCARLKAMKPASATAPPQMEIVATPAARTPGGRSTDGPRDEISHMTAPVSSATIGGGTFNSRTRIWYSLKPDDPYQRPGC